MTAFKDFLKRKDIEFSAKRYFIDAMGAMAQGLFCSLLIGTIINTIGAQLGIEFLQRQVSGYTIGGFATAMSGPAMAVALVTTFYGSLLANWICAPVAGKLKMKDAQEFAIKGIEVEGLLSIQAGENPRVIEEKLKSFIAPKERGGGDEGAGGAGGE